MSRMMSIRLPVSAIAGVAIATLALFMAALPAAAEAYSEQETRNIATVQAGFDAWKAGTGSPYDDLAENAQWTITGNSAASRLYSSREDFISNVIRPFNARMSVGLVPTISDIYADKDTVVVHFTAAGTAADNKPYENTYAWFLQLEGDRIIRATAFFDSVAFNDLWTRVTPATP
ncbi:nuclear transport factor 2 family protein [Rhizobium panacihumi]|uniref:nuclear transport factor 2 family protein n=1 Tax=Rhizobium panacihumi TaxID=2008450 RepID=UPI003D78D9F1